MTFQLDSIVPWGRSLAEYVAMFGLTDDDLNRSILGCADGPADFNSEWTRLGGHVVSIDPLYAFRAEEIRGRIDQTFSVVMEQTEQNQHEFIWSHIRSVADLGQVRMNAMQRFLQDFEQGKSVGRYQVAALPQLDYPDDHFDVALCSHFLFLYSDQLSLEFHLASVNEMCRVASDVRIFPLLQLGSTRSPHVDTVLKDLRERGRQAEIVRVAYEFQRGGNEMLRITIPERLQ